jgi:hypothetical protein
MKKFIVLLALLPSLAFAVEPLKEMFVQLDPQAQIVITNAPCKLYNASENVQLNYAYAINIETGEKVEGCFTHHKDIIQIELKDDKNNFYSYKIHSDNFQVRPNL